MMQEVSHPTASVSWLMERPGGLLRVRGTFKGWHALDHPWGAKMEAHHMKMCTVLFSTWIMIFNLKHSDLYSQWSPNSVKSCYPFWCKLPWDWVNHCFILIPRNIWFCHYLPLFIDIYFHRPNLSLHI